VIAEEKRRKIRILLAEDNITNQKVALGILERLGLRADPVANGNEVLAAVEAIRYDLVLMDVQMPEMDGFEATAAIRRKEKDRGKHIPIIAMTSHAMFGDRDRCLDAGMDDYVSKPIRSEDLVAAIERWLGKARVPQREAAAVAGPEEVRGDSESAPAIFDKQGFLDRVGGDEALCREVLEVFLNDVPLRIEQLAECLDAKDALAVERQAHALKGAAANVGAESLRLVALDVETAAARSDLREAETWVDTLKHRFETFKGVVKQMGYCS
jgi:CheY-like chemotaxis protein/HPt (histidine-containing phosphotransfer) domain-containing protein